ncbi:hypothetical protein CAPTEDRAFT_185836 [Capitella teleta]|uniref:Vesicular, overexpressed in cancer, prosurvival protein 1 n=1 Tax=Capitella teleta TaxID=283909 RepID=R7TCJ9_CAPTE|nr:hypothetical protein CAPTEDRAFT_185836 [Capitella teleta]|eukprot:ELT91458.1 hypothetical protein CAPTEDRAFT_185836 [Capitella teleta]
MSHSSMTNWILLVLLSLIDIIQARSCQYYDIYGILEINYSCPLSQRCCGNGKCCSQYVIYRMWYFWLCSFGAILIFSLVGGFYFRSRNRNRCRIMNTRANAMQMGNQTGGMSIVVTQSQQQQQQRPPYPPPPRHLPPPPSYNQAYAQPTPPAYFPQQMPPPYAHVPPPTGSGQESSATAPMQPGYGAQSNDMNVRY